MLLKGNRARQVWATSAQKFKQQGIAKQEILDGARRIEELKSGLLSQESFFEMSLDAGILVFSNSDLAFLDKLDHSQKSNVFEIYLTGCSMYAGDIIKDLEGFSQLEVLEASCSRARLHYNSRSNPFPLTSLFIRHCPKLDDQYYILLSNLFPRLAEMHLDGNSHMRPELVMVALKSMIGSLRTFSMPGCGMNRTAREIHQIAIRDDSARDDLTVIADF